MKLVGAHVSAAKGVYNAPSNADKIGSRAFALFVKNQRQWTAKPISQVEIKKFKASCRQYRFTPESILPHSSYLINLGHPQDEGLEKSRIALIDEIHRCIQLGLKYLNVHPGSHKGIINEIECLRRISDSINLALKETNRLTIVIENTSGQGGVVGYKFEHLRDIIDGITEKSRIGICLDTCHTFSAGYDIRTGEEYEKTMDKFSKIVGFKFLKALHLNDSKYALGSRKDRHQSLGKGEIGWDAFKRIMMDQRLNGMPLILETVDPTLWPFEIDQLYKFAKG